MSIHKKHPVVNKAAAPSTPVSADKTQVANLPRSLLVVSTGLLAFFLLRDLHNGLGWDEIAYDITDYTIWVSFAVIGILVSIGLGIQKLWDGKWPAGLEKTSFSRLEKLSAIMGMMWAVSIVFSPWLALFLNVFDLTPSNWRVLLGIRATLFVVVPVICVVPQLRFVRGRAALAVLAFLAVGTVFPALIGMRSAIDLVRGPVWQTVSVRSFGADALDLVKLSDGRILRYQKKLDPALQSGSVQQALVLRASRYILDVR